MAVTLAGLILRKRKNPNPRGASLKSSGTSKRVRRAQHPPLLTLNIPGCRVTWLSMPLSMILGIRWISLYNICNESVADYAMAKPCKAHESVHEAETR